jgi:hypothetical protein
MLLARGRHDEARAVLLELEQTSGVRGDVNVATNLPELTRCALAVGDAALARRLSWTASSPSRRSTSMRSARTAPSSPKPRASVPRPPRSTPRRRDGGRSSGRCPSAPTPCSAKAAVSSLGRPAAKVPLAEARELFTSLGYRPALADIEALLAQGEAAAV